MAITFPASPTNGQKFTSGTVVYTYSTATGAWSAAPRSFAEPFNYFINGAFQVSQQNVNVASTATAYYPADMWNQEFVGAMVPTIQRVQVPTPFGSANRIRVTVTTADTSLTTTDHYQIYCRLEGTRIAPFGWNTTAKKPMVVRFGFKGPAGTYGMAICNGAFNYIYAASFTITAGQANTDTIQTFAVPVPPAGTWVSAATTTVGMQFCIWLASGPSYVGVAGWNNAAVYVAPGLSNGMGVAAAVFEIFDFGMYRDPAGTGRAPPWEIVSEEKTVFECQRYWARLAGTIGVALATTATPQRSSFPNRATMRGNPASAFVGVQRGWDQATAPNLTAVANNYSNTMVFEYNYTAASAQTAGRGTMVLDASASIYMAQNARL